MHGYGLAQCLLTEDELMDITRFRERWRFKPAEVLLAEGAGHTAGEQLTGGQPTGPQLASLCWP